MTQPSFKGVKDNQIVDPDRLYRDTRPMYQQYISGLNNRVGVLVLMSMLCFAMVFPVVPAALSYPLFLFLLLVAWLRKRAMEKENLPFRMPATSGLIDYGSPKPGRTGFKKAEGVFMLGNAFGTERTELWMGISDMLTHMLVFGTTGSGKTEFLVSMAFNALAMGSGMFYVDPKAAPKLQAQIYVMCRICGRDDDFRTLNYLTSEKSGLSGKNPLRTTNTTNPFAYGNAESLSNMLISLIPTSEGSNAIFSQNAMTMMRSLMYALVEMRDRGEIQLSVETIRDYVTLQRCMELAERTDFSPNTRASLQAFLTSVGWQEGKPLDKQPRSLPEQFGYARSYFGQPLNSLTDTYGHIYRTPMGEVDMRDVVMQRRVLVVLLPSLAVAPEELKNLGKVSLSAIRIAISVGLGDGKEGTFADTLYALPTDAPAPFLSVTDEYAAIPTPGYVEVLTQGRGLGVAAIVASQDYAGITKADEAGAQQLLENTKVKVALKLTSASDTWELFQKLAGQVSVMEAQSYQIKPDQGVMSTDYRDQLSAGPKERNRIVLSDLQNQVEGEFHAFFNDAIVRGSSFFANPPLPANMQIRINQMVKVYPPDPKSVEMKYGLTRKIVDDLLKTGERILADSSGTLESAETRALESASGVQPRSVAIFRGVFSNSKLGPMETAIAALVLYAQEVAREDEEKALFMPPGAGGRPVRDTEFEGDEDEFEMLPETDEDLVFDEKGAIGEMNRLNDAYRGLNIKDLTRDMTQAGVLSGMPRQTAQAEAQRIARSVEAAVVQNYPTPPVPKDNAKKKDALGQALNNFLTQSRKKNGGE